MNRSLYIAATGMNAQQSQMDVISNNLANVSTNGFKVRRSMPLLEIHRCRESDAGMGPRPPRDLLALALGPLAEHFGMK